MSIRDNPNLKCTRAVVKKLASLEDTDTDNLLYDRLTQFRAVKSKTKLLLPVLDSSTCDNDNSNTCNVVAVYKSTSSTNAAESLKPNTSFSVGTAVKSFFSQKSSLPPAIFNPTIPAEKCLVNISALSESDKVLLLDTALNSDSKRAEGFIELATPIFSLPSVSVEDVLEEIEPNSVTKDVESNDFWWDSSYTDLNNDCLCDAIEVSAVIDEVNPNRKKYYASNEFHWINSTELSVNDFDDLALNTAILASPTDDNKLCVFDSNNEDLSIFTNAFVSHDNTVLSLNNDVQTYINQIVGVNEKQLNILHTVDNFETVSIPVSCENPPSPETKPFTLFSSPAINDSGSVGDEALQINSNDSLEFSGADRNSELFSADSENSNFSEAEISSDEMSSASVHKMSPFSGAYNDNPEIWLDNFRLWSETQRGLTPLAKLAHFSLFMKDSARSWIKQFTFVDPERESDLEEGELSDFELLAEQFLERFRKPQEVSWREISNLFEREQGPNEKTEEFVNSMIQKDESSGATPSEIKMATLHGLRLDIKKVVSLQDIGELRDIVRWGITAENLAQKDTADSNSTLDELKQIIKNLQSSSNSLSAPPAAPAPVLSMEGQEYYVGPQGYQLNQTPTQGYQPTQSHQQGYQNFQASNRGRGMPMWVQPPQNFARQQF